MATLVESSIPEITRQISDPEPDVVVKSKPLPVSSLVVEEEREEEDTTSDVEPDVVVKSKPLPSTDAHFGGDTNDAAVLEVTEEHRQEDQSSTRLSEPARKANGDAVGVNKKVAPSQAVAESIDQAGLKEVEERLEDSTAVVLRRYTASKNGRQGQIPITSMGEIGGSIPLQETFKVAGKSCTVRLEEDHVSWAPTGKKEGEKERERESVCVCVFVKW